MKKFIVKRLIPFIREQIDVYVRTRPKLVHVHVGLFGITIFDQIFDV